MKRTTMLVAALLAILLGGLPADSAAQGVQTGSIRGTVTDQQNLPVPGVTVTIQSPALQGIRSTVTEGDGSYSLQQLPPGRYQLTYEIASFAPVKRTTDVLLGLSAEQNVTLTAAGRTEEVQVVASAPAPIVNPTVGANYKHEEIQSLAVLRTLQGISSLAPGVTENTPNAGQLAINGGFAFDNVFMLNGVDVNDNLFGSPQNLFIEDAIEETQILTSGITAEYGRFTGGVVNAITKSGGNSFSGSWRTNFSNPSWTRTTPLERCDQPGVLVPTTCRPAAARLDELQFSHEATLGGPIIRDRLWFFGATRLSEVSTSSSLPQTNLQNTLTENNKRVEIKLTGNVASNHTFQGGYLNNSTEQASRPTFSFTIDQFSVGNRTLPNWYTYGNYRGILRNNLLVEAQFSQRKYQFKDSGGSLTDIVNSPIITLTQTLGHYNAQYFDANDPENRNNRQLTGNLTYFLNTPNAGRHEFKAGYEFFRSQRTGGNSQSATGYVFDADYATDSAGNPIFDAQGYLLPVFVPGETLIENWLPTRGATLNVDNNAIFAQDHIVINNRWSADVGFRYERVRSEATGGIVGVDTDTFVPRLAAAYDVQGNGKHIIHATYGWYSGRYNEAQIGNNNNVGNPDLLLGVYAGPPGQGRSFAPGFSPTNYETVFGQFPTKNVVFDSNLTSPLAKEFTTSYGVDLFNGRGYLETTYVHRDFGSIIEDLIDIRNRTTNVVVDGFDVGTFTNIRYVNSDAAWRQYDGMLFQGRYNLTNRWNVNGHYTLQFKNDGNYEGEATNQPGVTGRLGDYPEIFTAAQHYPDGRLDDFQRHKVRLWTIYNVGVGRFGDASLSALWRIDSGTSYSYVALGRPITSIQEAKLVAAGYPDEPDSQDIYYSERGANQFKGFQVVDLGATYNVPVFRTLRPYVNFGVWNAFNNQKLIRWNTTVTPDASSALDANGIPTGFVRGSIHGLANNNNQFPVPSIGGTGGRTWRVSVGFRF
jgi:outer membrane receptor protein involved in Fe transport